MIKKTVSYVRVSTLEQETALQESAIARWIAQTGATVEWVRDKATGGNTQRRGYQELLGQVKAGWVERVVVYDVSRIGRSAFENVDFARECLNRKVQLISLKDNVDVTTPEGQLVFFALSWAAERQREMIVLRAKEGASRRKAKGLPLGGTSKGWTFRRIQKDLKRFYEMIDMGFTNYHIRRVLGWNVRTIRKYRANRGQPVKTRKQRNIEVYGKSNAKI